MRQATNDNQTIPQRFLRALPDYLRSRGLDAEHLIADGLRKAAESRDTNGDAGPWAALFGHLIESTGDTELPLKFAETIRPRDYGLLGHVAMNCQTLGQAMQLLERYVRLVASTNEVKVLLHDGVVEIRWLPLPHASSPLYEQIGLAVWASFGRQLTARPEMRMEAYFRCPCPKDDSAYRRIFGGPVHFSQDMSKLIGPAEYFALPVVTGDPEIHRVLLERADTLMKEFGNEPDFVRRLRAAIYAQLTCYGGSLKQVACIYDCSPRTLQNRLQEYGLNYQELLDDVRHRAAKHYLRNPELTLAEIAFFLGYSEQSPFQSAFKRWTGITPGQYRKAALSMTPPLRSSRGSVERA